MTTPLVLNEQTHLTCGIGAPGSVCGVNARYSFAVQVRPLGAWEDDPPYSAVLHVCEDHYFGGDW